MLIGDLEKATSDLFETDRKIISLLLSQNLLEPAKLEFIIKDPKNKIQTLEKLIELNFVSLPSFQNLLIKNFDISCVDIENIDFTQDVRNQESLINIFKKEGFIPLSETASEIIIASRFALNTNENIKINNILKTTKAIKLQFIFSNDLQNLLQKLFRDKNAFPIICNTLNTLNLQNIKRGEALNIKDPIVEFSQILFEEAAILRAEEIDFTCDEVYIKIRFKIDLVFREVGCFHKEIWARIINRLKILSGISINESLKMQEGRMQTFIYGYKYDIFFFFIPTNMGESVNIKIVKQFLNLQSLESFNFTKTNLQKIFKILEQKEGVVVMNSETQTIFDSLLNTLDLKSLNIYNLIKDYQIKLPFVKNITSEINPDFIKINQPDILIANNSDNFALNIQSKVFYFTDNNDAFSLIQNVNTHKICGTIIIKKIRKLCDFCKSEVLIETETLAKLRIAKTDVRKIYKACGCPECKMIGYKGTILICEVLNMDLEIEELLQDQTLSRKAFLEFVKRKGFATIFEDARLKVLQGLTDIEELKRSVV